MRDLAAGKLLVAARSLPDPNFAETVVLLADYSEEGAMGLIVNRQTEVTLARLMPGLQNAKSRAAFAFLGGPVAMPEACSRCCDRPPPAATPAISSATCTGQHQ